MKKFSSALLFIIAFSFSAYAQHTKQTLKKVIVDHFFTCPLDDMLDTISIKYKIPIVFDREEIHHMDVANRFFEESLLNVLDYICRAHGLQYWIEKDGTIYILQQPDDLSRLRLMNKYNKERTAIKPVPLAPAQGPPKRFGFAITGRVKDQNTGESLPGASVKVRKTEISTLTNINGDFTLLKIPSDTVVLDVSFVGYQMDSFRLTSKNIDSALVFTLFPSMNAMSEVDIESKKAGVLNTDTKRVSVLQLAPSALDKLPNIGERDVMRAFQLMPGVSATNESSSGAYVRGGTPDQNLVTFDGFTVYQVDHLYGFFSAFNSNAIRDVDLYKGGYSAKYGGRLSSVTEIRGKDGNKNETNIGGDISLLSTNIYAETPVGDKSSALVAYRHSYQGPLYDKIFGQFNTSTVNNGPGGGGGRGGPGGGFGRQQVTPSSYFYDLNVKYVFTPSPKNNFAFSFYNGSDHTDNSREMNLPSFSDATSSSDIQVNDNAQSGNTGASLKWGSTISKKFFANTVFSYSQFYSDRNRGSSGSVTDSGITKNFSNGMLEHNKLRDFSFKSDWEYQVTSKAKVLFGGYSSLLHIQYTYTQNDTSKLISQDNRGVNAGLYTEMDWDITPKLHLQPGIRSTYFSPTGKNYVEPRFSFTYKLTDKFNLKGATGEFYQFTDQVTREDITGGDRTFWVLANNTNIPVSSAEHYIAGFNYETDDFLFDVEGYYKQYHNLTEYSIRQSGGIGAGGGGMRFAPTTSGTTTLTEDFYNGTGYAKGIEFLLQKKAGLYTGWISYTLGQAKSQYDAYGPDYFSSLQDITHEFKSINMYHWQRWSFAAVFIFSTGHPYTAPLGVYTVNTLDGNKTSYLTISAKNGERLPDYHRLDMSATYDILKIDGKKTGSIGLSLFNVYNHVNTWYNEYYIRDNQVVTTTVKYLGFTPNITLSLKWK